MISTRGPFLLTLEYIRCVSVDDEIDNLSLAPANHGYWFACVIGYGRFEFKRRKNFSVGRATDWLRTCHASTNNFPPHEWSGIRVATFLNRKLLGWIRIWSFNKLLNFFFQENSFCTFFTMVLKEPIDLLIWICMIVTYFGLFLGTKCRWLIVCAATLTSVWAHELAQ